MESCGRDEVSTQICLIGQSNLFRAGLKLLLDETDYSVAEEVCSVREALKLAWRGALYLIDKPADIREIECDLAALKSVAPASRVVLLAKSVETEQLALGFAAGVDGYLLEEISPEALLESLNLVILGEKVFPSRLAVLLCGRNWALRSHQSPMPCDVPLSERELEIVCRLTEGLPNKVIANEMDITEATVKVHLKTILKKLGLCNRTQAAIWAVQNGLAAGPDLLNANGEQHGFNSAA